ASHRRGNVHDRPRSVAQGGLRRDQRRARAVRSRPGNQAAGGGSEQGRRHRSQGCRGVPPRLRGGGYRASGHVGRDRRGYRCRTRKTLVPFSQVVSGDTGPEMRGASSLSGPFRSVTTASFQRTLRRQYDWRMRAAMRAFERAVVGLSLLIAATVSAQPTAPAGGTTPATTGGTTATSGTPATGAGTTSTGAAPADGST